MLSFYSNSFTENYCIWQIIRVIFFVLWNMSSLIWWSFLRRHLLDIYNSKTSFMFSMPIKSKVYVIFSEWLLGVSVRTKGGAFPLTWLWPNTRSQTNGNMWMKKKKKTLTNTGKMFSCSHEGFFFLTIYYSNILQTWNRKTFSHLSHMTWLKEHNGNAALGKWVLCKIT